MEVRLSISDPAKDAQGIDSMTYSLLAELRERNVVAASERVLNAGGGVTKSVGDAVGWGQLLLTLVGSGGALVTLVGCGKEWLMRQPPTTTIKIAIGSDVLELGSSDLEFLSKTTQEFIALHPS
jgi:hypothetical protein